MLYCIVHIIILCFMRLPGAIFYDFERVKLIELTLLYYTRTKVNASRSKFEWVFCSFKVSTICMIMKKPQSIGCETVFKIYLWLSAVGDQARDIRGHWLRRTKKKTECKRKKREKESKGKKSRGPELVGYREKVDQVKIFEVEYLSWTYFCLTYNCETIFVLFNIVSLFTDRMSRCD